MKIVALFFLLSLFVVPAQAAAVYQIEAAHDDEAFIINGEKFSAQTYCMGWDEGDDVIFLDGSADGACSSATLYNKSREEKCDVYCD